MKIKHTMKVAILSALTAMGGGILFTSCEDMFTTDNGLVTDDLAPKDTVYTMMGIVKNMQRIMDRTVIFGELRSDLVDVGVNTPFDLRDVAGFNVSDKNAYNEPRDFYNVINSCNIYLANVDAQRRSIHTGENSYGELYFEKEIIATKCFRAWTYLQLAQIYGAQNIPFITEPVVTADAAEQMVANTANRTTMDALCTFFINDIKQYADKIEDNELLVPDYSVTFESGQETNTKISYSKFFIPVRLMLAELYLWRGSFTQSVADFREAVRYYHEFLTHGTDTRNYLLGSNRVEWRHGSERFSSTSNSYFNQFRLASRSMVTVLPMDTTTYYGNTSNIREVFSSKYSNNYYPAAVPSERLKEISQAQNYLYVDYTGAVSLSDIETEYAPKDEATLRTRFDKRWWMYVGDLRFNGNCTLMDYNNSEHADYSSEWSFINKWEFNGTGSSITTTDQRPEFMPIYRLAIVYLHLAEALNRAGFPESAFVILKYGLSTSALQNYAPSEFEALKAITAISSKDVNFTEWDVNYFVTPDMVTFTSLVSHEFNQWPIHAYGCGDVYFDENYTIGASLSDPKYAQGDETLQYVLDDEGVIIRDEEGNPDLTADGTKVYNYGVWTTTQTSGGSTVWDGFNLSSLPDYWQSTMSYDDFLNFLAENTMYVPSPDTDITTLTDEELHDIYNTYVSDCNAFQTTLNHNLAVKAAAAPDRQADVAMKILNEEALEGMFEGHRFGDLMRYSWQEGNPALLGQAVSKRPGTTSPDGTLASKLASEAGWYVKLPTR
ncbi:MAG: RagB/SusD family nutrient uptake outer membrane protein [Bacteroidales bacterium]|nr:RagB/SusD family nutrient uptake outer membrane protein [Bacteroidales bacterium]